MGVGENYKIYMDYKILYKGLRSEQDVRCKRPFKYCTFQTIKEYNQSSESSEARKWSEAVIYGYDQELPTLVELKKTARGRNWIICPVESPGWSGATMVARKGLLAPQNTFLDTIAARFDGTRKFIINPITFQLSTLLKLQWGHIITRTLCPIHADKVRPTFINVKCKNNSANTPPL